MDGNKNHHKQDLSHQFDDAGENGKDLAANGLQGGAGIIDQTQDEIAGGNHLQKVGCVAASTIRYYDKEGLLPFVERSEGGIRVFTDVDLIWLRLIACLKSTGMPIKDIRRYVQSALEGDRTIGERLEIIYEQRQRLREQMAQLQKTMDIVEYKCWYYETAKATGSESVLKEMTMDDIPEKHHAAIRHLHAETI